MPSSRPRHLGKKLALVVFGLALVPVVLLVAEGVLALAGVGEAALYSDPFVGFAGGRSLFHEVVGEDGVAKLEVTPEKLAFFNHQEMPAEKAPGTYRLFVVGGSTVAGRPYDDRVAFPRFLELYLEAAAPQRRWEVVNAGAISYASYRILLLMKELVRYEPDLFVVLTGHNEFLEERTYTDVIHMSPVERRLRVWLGGLRSFNLAREALLGPGDADEEVAAGATLEPEVTAKLDGWTGLDRYHRDPELEAGVVSHFAFNLAQMAALARDHDAEILFVQPASNLAGFSPFKSEHGEALGEAERVRFGALLAEGEGLLDAGEPARAVPHLEEAVALDPLHAEARFRLGRARLLVAEGAGSGSREGADGETVSGATRSSSAAGPASRTGAALLGEPAGADAGWPPETAAVVAADLVAAKDLDVAPLRALTPLVEAVAEVGESYGVPVVPLPEILARRVERRTGRPVPGDETFLDHVHPDVPVHALIAALVHERMVAEGWAPAPPEGFGERRREILDGVVSELDPEVLARRDLALSKVLGWAGKLEEAEAPLLRAVEALPEEPEAHLNLGILYQRTGRLEEALAPLERALELRPGLPLGHFNLGVVLGRLGETEGGIEALRRATRLDPEYAEAWQNLGVLLRRSGRLREALAALERARDLSPEAPEVATALAVTYRRLGREREAEAELARALELAPERSGARAQALVERALADAREGRHAEAAAGFEEALAIEPGDAEALFNLGVARAALDRPAEAAEAYRRALASDPGHARAHNNLGILLAGRGDLEAARRELEAAVEAAPEWAEAWFNLALVHDRTGRPGEARRAVERAAALDPGEERYVRALEALRRAGG